jgi:excisionase family DNA binding protein
MPKKPPAESALYVRIPAAAIDRLRRAAETLGVHQKDLVASLVSKYVDPDSPRGLDALGSLSQPRRVTVEMNDAGPTLGSYSFRPYDPPEPPPPPEVMSAEQAARFLQVEEAVIIELAEAGELPGRKLGRAWRFSRAALVTWLSQPEPAR